MRLLTYRSEGVDRAGVRTDDGVLDAAGLLGEERIGVRELLGSGRLGELGGRAAAAEVPGLPESELELAPPIPDPEKIVCIGLNYHDHAKEAGVEPPDVPTMFAKFPNALAGSGAEVELPGSSGMVDYEAEVAFVVGRTSKGLDPDQALEAIGGFMLLNDL